MHIGKLLYEPTPFRLGFSYIPGVSVRFCPQRPKFSNVTQRIHFQLFTDLANAANIVGYPKEKRLLDARTWYVVLLTVLAVNNYLKMVNQWVAIGLLVSCIAAAVIHNRTTMASKWISCAKPSKGRTVSSEASKPS